MTRDRLAVRRRAVRRTDRAAARPPWGVAAALALPLSLAVASIAPPALQAQAPAGTASARPARAVAPFDLTGYWVAVVTSDWRQRMVTPARGDYASVPLTLEARKMADAWDPERDAAEGEACRSYGAPAVMRNPGRVRIGWQDDMTLKVETDAGQQTRLLHFGPAPRHTGAPPWQGDSSAEWRVPAVASNPDRMYGSLKVITTRARQGYLRKNGIPYSPDAVLTEHWDLLRTPEGATWLTITSTVEDPRFLRTPWITALHFRKEADGSRWNPTPCSAIW